VVQTIGVADLPRVDDLPAASAALQQAGGEVLEVELGPDGLATPVGTVAGHDRELSGGQWQTLAVARAFRRPDPLLVVFDEPAASLDAVAEHAMFTRYAERAVRGAERSGTITLFVTHRLTTARAADLIVFIDQGHVVESGSHEQLMGLDGRYAELVRLQESGFSGAVEPRR